MLKLLISTLMVIASVHANANQLMTPLTPVKVANGFTLETPEGESLSLSDFQGKYVLVNFWAYWCTPCIKEFPDMQELYDQSDKSNFEIIAIHAGPYNEQAAEFVKKFGITFPVVSDPDTSLKGWDVPALPISYLINPDGNIEYKAIGPRTWNVDEVNNLLSN